MKNKSIFLLLMLILTMACHKEQPLNKKLNDRNDETLSLDTVKLWVANQIKLSKSRESQQLKLAQGRDTISNHPRFVLSKLQLKWSKAESMKVGNQNYWIMALDGQPVYQGINQGYRKIAFLKDLNGSLMVRILEIVPDGLVYQRRLNVSTKDFTGRIFIYDENYHLLGGKIWSDGKLIGLIKNVKQAAGPGIGTKTKNLSVWETTNCQWIDENYIDAERGVVIYAYQVCTYVVAADDGSDFNGGSGDYAGEAGGGGGNAGNAPLPSNLPGESGPKIDPKKYIDCFGNIPDKGATYKIVVYVQEPWPGTSFNIGPNSVGHTAIGLTKTNGSTSVTQIVGFYPDATGFSKMHAPSKLLDNSSLDYNCSITYTTNATEFGKIAAYVSTPPSTYDLSTFNCTNFVVSACQSGHITLPNSESITGFNGATMSPVYSLTPAGLGTSLDKMKNQKNVITTGGIGPFSKGPCN